MSTHSEPVSRREALKASLIFSSALMSGGWLRAAVPEGALPGQGAEGLHFLAMGDFGSGKKGQIQIAKQMNEFAGRLGSPLTAVLALGDNFYNQLELPRFETGFEAIYSKQHLDCPFYACLGNHDYGPSYDSRQGRPKADMQLEYARTHPTSRWKMPAKWYAVELPNPTEPLVKIIFLDGNMFEGALTPAEKLAQKRFLEAELQRPTRAKWTWMISHYPLFSDDTLRKDSQSLIAQWGPYLQKYPISLYLSGHDHSLQHLQVEGYQPSFVVSGGGGARLYHITSTGRGFSNAQLGFNHIHVTRERIAVQFVDVDGRCVHAFQRDLTGRVS